ncbi:MAG: helix-turn-helix domain-containing protein [Lawsonibacter sp.]
MDRSLFHAPEEELLRGGLEHCEPFPGVEFSWIRFHAPRIETEHAPLAHVLEVNHCRRGRIGWDMKGGTSVYLGPGDLDVHTMDCCAVSTINLPLGYYEGITVALDLEQLERTPLPLVEEAGIDACALLDRLCPGGEPLALPAGAASARIFDPLYTAPERLRLPYCRLKALELLLFLEALEPEREKRLDRYYSRQVETIQEIHALLTGDLGRRYTIEELSRRYLINTATLKAVFKAVYSQPIGAYMKEYRLRRAMELLRQGGESIAEIAAQVGYESQGKFTEAFKAYTHQLPTEYRRQNRSTVE